MAKGNKENYTASTLIITILSHFFENDSFSLIHCKKCLKMNILVLEAFMHFKNTRNLIRKVFRMHFFI